MGLNERRAIQSLQETSFPEWKKQIEAAAGFQPPIDVDWDSIALEGQSHLYTEGFEKIYVKPIISAFKSVASDKMGADALKTSLKKIVICNKDGNYSPGPAITFTAGTLKIDHLPTSNLDDIAGRAKAIQTLLEQGL